MKPLKLGLTRENLRMDAVLESVYEPDGAKRLKEQEEEAERQSNKGLIHMFGYKHDKALKFYGNLLRCMRDCYESRFEQLNIDMNFFLLLKNELSLAFLRNQENIVQTLKCAIRIWASEDEANRTSDELNELTWIMKILGNQPVEQKEKSELADDEQQEEVKEEQFIPDAENETQQQHFEKIINKLLDYNEKINGGKEIQVVEYLKRLSGDNDFM